MCTATKLLKPKLKLAKFNILAKNLVDNKICLVNLEKDYS